MTNPQPNSPTFCPECGVPTSGSTYCARCVPASTPETDATPKARKRSAAKAPRSSSMLRAALALYFTLLAVIAIFTIATQFEGVDATPQWQVNSELTISAVFAAVIFTFVFFFRRSILPLLTHLGPPAWLIAAPFIAAGTCSLASLIVEFINFAFGGQSQSYSEPALLAGYGLWLPIFTTAVCPAISEELAFRGVMNTALDRVLDPRDAALVTALLFAILHLSILSFPHLLVMGLVLGYIRHRSKSLYPCMLLHFSHNAFVVLLEYFNL